MYLTPGICSQLYITCQHSGLASYLPTQDEYMYVGVYNYTVQCMSFVCKVLICVSYPRCRGLADFNSTVMLTPLFQLCHCCMCNSLISCDLINLCLDLYKVLQENGHF